MCSNYVAEYEALIYKIIFILEKDFRALKVEGGSELMIQQVKLIYSCNMGVNGIF